MTAGRAARLTIMLSAALVIAAGVWIASSPWTNLPALTIGATALAFAVARVRPSWAPAVMLLPGCLLPALVREIGGAYDPAHMLIWMGGMLGGIAGLTGLTDWSMPRLWRLLLAHGALAVALGAIVVAGRELDWTFEFLWPSRVWVTAQGIHPRVAIVWLAYIASALLVGVLWLDALFARYRGEDDRPWREVAAPLAASAAIGATVAIVQMVYAIEWLNSGLFGMLGRAAGLLLDANALGMTAALGAALAFEVVRRCGRSAGAWPLAAVVVCLGGVWASGSRTALLVALMIAGAAAVTVVRDRRLSRRALLAGGAVVCVLAAAVVGTVLALDLQAVGPFARLSEWLGGRSLSDTLYGLWARDGYGLAAVKMIGDYPWTGVGPAMFHLMVLDYTFLIHYPVPLPTDNAQNWLRHLLAEQGVLGGAGWAIWSAVFAVFLVRRRVWRYRETLVPSAALAGLAAVSAFSVPTQTPAVLIMATTLVFFVARATDVTEDGGERGASAWAWRAVWIAALLFAAATFWVARTELRVPYRALRAGWAYQHGWYAVERSAGGPFRWTREHAVAVFPARPGYLRLRFWARHQAIETRPVDVRIRLRDEVIVDVTLRDREPVERYVYVPAGRPWLMIETDVSRTFRATDGGRELGLAMSDWTFVPRPPDGAVVITPAYDR